MHGILTELYPRLKYPNLVKGLIGAWCPCFGNTGPILVDRSGMGRHGILTNMDSITDWVASDGFLSLDYDGTAESVQITGSLLNGLEFASISSWVYRDNASNLLTFGPYVSGNRFTIFWQGANLYYTKDGDYNSIISVVTGWHMVTLTAKGRTLTLFLDGIPMSTVLFGSATISAAATGFIIGSGQGHSVGRFDDTLAWNRDLSISEVAQLYSIKRGGWLQLKPSKINQQLSQSITSTERRIKRLPKIPKHSIHPTIC